MIFSAIFVVAKIKSSIDCNISECDVSYRIIMLLNCQKKISEKIVATRLSHFVKHSNLLHNEEMRDRKNRFAIDAILCLLHDIQITKNSKNVFVSVSRCKRRI